MGIHYDYKSTKGNKLMEKQAKREKKLAEKKAKRLAKEGPKEEILKNKAKENINFKGQIVNRDLNKYFESNDVLILTSAAEPWGLVIEEALFFGIPVMVSNNCGACVLINEGVNGYIVDLNSTQSMRDIILSLDEKVYTRLLEGVRQFSINDKDIEQLKVYFAK